ncbi:MAG: hypothetical protein DCC52_17100, partial [Chloroflexi bacterium]
MPYAPPKTKTRRHTSPRKFYTLSQGIEFFEQSLFLRVRAKKSCPPYFSFLPAPASYPKFARSATIVKRRAMPPRGLYM